MGPLIRVILVLALTLTGCTQAAPSASASAATPAASADQVPKPAGADTRCPVRAADLDKLTSYHWKFSDYKTDRPFIGATTPVRVDSCELIGYDAKGDWKDIVVVSIAKDANAEAFAKHWHAACAGSIVKDMQGRVQPVSGVTGGMQCVTSKGNSSFYWIERAGRSIHLEVSKADDTSVSWPDIFPRLLASVVQ